MKLVRIAKGRWDVVAVVDGHGRCPVLDLLDGAGPGRNAARDSMSPFLRLYMPLEGPPKFNPQLCRSLGNGIFELRRPPQGAKPEVLFFSDEDLRRIVCTSALLEAKTAHSEEVLSARGLRERYLETKSRSEIQVVEAIGPGALDSVLTEELT